MITCYSLEPQSIRKHQMLLWLTLLLLIFIPFFLSAQPPVASGDCSRSLLEFDGLDDEISVSIPDFSYASGTIEAWVRKDNWQDAVDDALFSNGIGHTGTNSFYVSFHPAVGLHFRYGGQGESGNTAAYATVASTSGLAANSWHHVAATWNNDGSNTTLSIYLDGALIISTATSTNLILSGPTTFGISRGAYNSHYVLQGGSIAEMRVWNVARTQTEISSNMNTLLTGSESNLISYWPINDGSGTSVSNLVPDAASGTILNMDPGTEWTNEFPIRISSGDIISKGGSYSFGTFEVDESSAGQVFTITNNGKDAIDLSTNPISALSGDNADQFELNLTTTSSSLAAGASTTFSITFTPTSEGVKTALFSFANVSGCAEPYTINLSGIGSNMQGSINVDADVLIHGQSTGQLTASASGGVEPYTYLWSNGAANATINNLAAGIYSVVITDNIGATVTASAEVTQPSKLEAYVSVDSHVTSYGGDDGQLSASGYGGVMPYEYSWSNAGTSAVITGLIAGEYTVTITDANGASAAASATVTQPLPLEANVIITNNLSGGSASDGELNAYGQYGDKPYTFLWSTGATTSTISDLSAGTYSVTITDTNGQTDSETFELGMDWNASISYYGPGFTETTANNGELKGSITAQLKGDLYNGTGGMLEDNAVTVTSVNGLTAEVEVMEMDTIAKTWNKLSVSEFAPDYLYSIGYVNDKFIAYGSNDGQSAIFISNGDGWIKNTVSNRTWVSFGYALGKYVALSYDGYAINSTDGEYWSEEDFLTDCNWSDIAFGNGIFVAVASGYAESAVMVSEDGVNWDDPSTLINKSWQSILFVEGRFIAVSSDGDIMTSTDGQSWSLTEGLIGSDYVEDMAYGNGVYVAVTGDTDGEIWQSSNCGVTWSQKHSEIYVEWEEVEYGAGSFVVISHDDTDIKAMRSIDGISWDEVFISDNSLNGIAYGQGQFLVSVDNSGKDWFYKSEHNAKAELVFLDEAENHFNSDDVADIVFNFTDQAFANLEATEVENSIDASSGFGIDFIKDPTINYSGDGFVEVEANDGAVEGSIIITLSGDNFSEEDLEIDNHVALGNVPEGLDPSISVTSNHTFITDWNNSTDESIVNTYIAAAYGDSVFVAITGGSNYLYSEDGINWVEKTFSQSDWADITYGNGRFVAVGQSDFVITSTDGDYWSYHSVEGNWNSITYGNGLFVAVGEYQTMTSTDGVEWTITDDDTYTDWLAVAFGSGVFVAVGPYEEDLMYSSNGSDWTHLDLAISDGFEDISYGNDVFVAVSNNGFVLTSSNGSDWDQYSIPSGYWNSISYGGGEFLIVGDVYAFDNPEMLRSSNGTGWRGVNGEIDDIGLKTALYAQDVFYLFTGDSDQWLFTTQESKSVAELTFSGNATDHLAINSVENITFEFSDGAFDNTSAEYILNATGPASSNLGVAFNPVDNDNCTEATNLTVFAAGEGAFTSGTTELANTFDGSVGCAVDGTVNDVWYKFTTTSTGSLEINLDLGTAAKLSGAIYATCGGDAIYCVDSLSERVFLPVAADVDIYMQVWTSEEEAGTFSIRVNAAPTAWVNQFGEEFWTGGTPTAEDDALILAPYSTTAYGALEVNDLEIYFDGLLYAGYVEVASEDTLTVNGDLTNNGGLHIASGGSLLTYGQVTSKPYRTVNLEFLQFFEGTMVERQTTFDQTTGRYSIVGSPIEQGSFDSLGVNSLVYAYDESALYNPFGNKGLDRFKTPTQLELVNMEAGKGYFSAFTGDENGTVWFTGTPNHGTIDVDLSYTDQGNADEVSYQGFNLVSNPYPAAISTASFFDENSSVDYDGSIYIWDDFGSDTQRGSNADYFVVNTLGNTNSRADGEEKFDGYIRSAQGFFVKANSSGQTLQFNDYMKVSGHNSDGGYYRMSTPEIYKIQITGEAGLKAIVLGFVDDATTSRDKGYDAQLMDSDLELYTVQPSDNQKLSIQGLPKNFSEELGLGFSCREAGVYTIGLSQAESNQVQLWLSDMQTGKKVDLTLDTYTFNTLAGEFNNRFVLTRGRVLEIQPNTPMIYAYDKVLYIPQSLITSEKQLTDVSGRKVMTIPAGAQTVNLSSLPNGVYLISNGTSSQKLLIK